MDLSKKGKPIAEIEENDPINEEFLTDARGEEAQEWLKKLGDSDAARNDAEFGIGTTVFIDNRLVPDKRMLII